MQNHTLTQSNSANVENEDQLSDSSEQAYQYTRAIRFKLDPQRQSQDFQNKLKDLKSSESQTDLLKLSELLLKTHTSLKDLLFTPKAKDKKCKANTRNEISDTSEKDRLKWRKKLSVSKNWLKVWHKHIFHASIKNIRQNKDGKYKFQELKPIHEDLKQRLSTWKEQTEKLQGYCQQPKESQVRHSDIVYIIRWFLNRQRLPYIQELLREIHVPYSNLDNKVRSLKDDVQKLQDDLKIAETCYQSSQSAGIEFAKASFNYYTVNKKPKIYCKDRLEQSRYNNFFTIIKNHHWYNSNNDQNLNQRNEIFFFKSDLEKEWLKRYIDKYNANNDNKYKIQDDLQNGVKLSLDQTYDMMKAFKAEQKSIFYELMTRFASKEQSGKTYKVKNDNHLLKGYEIGYQQHNLKGINAIFSLFQFQKKRTKEKDEEKYKEFLKLTQNIEQDSKKKKEYAKQRGKEFLFGRRCYFSDYWNFCEKYKRVAQKRGRLIAQIKGIEKEREEAENTDYWSLIYVGKDHKQLWLIPKNVPSSNNKDESENSNQKTNLQNAKSFIDNKKDIKGDNYSKYLCCFQSLTMRALHKLCFAEEGTFVKEMREKDEYLWNLQKEVKQRKTDGDSDKIKEKNQKKLELLKKVLKSDYAQSRLQLKGFKSKDIYKNIDEAKNLDEFEKALEEACYFVKKIHLTENEKEQFLKEYDVTVLDLTSYDLQGRNKNIHQTPESENRLHTDLWQIFWQNLDKSDKRSKVKGFSVGEVRLNPEIKIRYRKANEELKTYLEKKGFNKEFKKGRTFTQRGIEDQFFTASLTLALNAGNKYEDLAFTKPEELCEKINDFNAKINFEGGFRTAWKYGIDRGQMELATLCLAKFNPKKTYKVNDKKILKPEFAPIECYTLTDYNHQVSFNDGKPRKDGKTHRMAIDNLSYFIKDIEDKSLFEKKSTSCLDLTTAKVIKGHIMTNGDMRTYLKLKKVSAKRKLYEFYAKDQINSGTQLKCSKHEHGKTNHHRPEGVLNINIRNDKGDPETTVYYYCKEYKDILSKDCIEEDLKRYLEELKNKDASHTPSILKINHLENALTGNMIGVICHLMKTYPGFVILEDLKKGHGGFQNDASIFRNIEVALYNKFQSMALVLSHVKDIIQLREDVRDHQKKEQQQDKDLIKSSQIGTIVFVDEKDTSKLCPHCEEKQNISNEDKFYFKRFRCQSCDFDTYAFKAESERVQGYQPKVKEESYDKKFQFLKDIDDPDKVAAYNIAKKLKNSDEIGKWKLPSSQTKEETHNGNSRDKKNHHKRKNQQNGQYRHVRSKGQRGKQHRNNDRKKHGRPNSNPNYQIKAQNKQSKGLTSQPFAVLKTMKIKTNVSSKKHKESRSNENQ